MMGGGTILHEAIRLGANVIGYDIDPIPVLQKGEGDRRKASSGGKRRLSDDVIQSVRDLFRYLFIILD